MVIGLLNFIGDEVKDRNLYFDKHTSIAYQQEDGKVYKFTTDSEREYCGPSDTDGVAFYIKVNPIATFTTGRQLTSSKQVSQGTIECTLIAYRADGEINTLSWQSKIVQALKSINFSGYTGRETHVKIEIKSANNSPEQIFKQETAKDLESDLKIVAIQYNVLFNSNEFDCNECNIFSDCGGDDIDVCAQFVSRFNNLPSSIKECIVEQIAEDCPPCADVTIYESDGVTVDQTVPAGGSYTKVACPECPEVPTCTVAYADPFITFTPDAGTLIIDMDFSNEELVCGHILMRRGENDNVYSTVGAPILFDQNAGGAYQIIDPSPLPGFTLYQVITKFISCPDATSDATPYINT